MKLPSLLLMLCLARALVVSGAEPPGKTIFANLCFACHGVNGEGNPQIKSPSIASLPAWYVVAQLRNFQHDRRGFDPKDVEGQIMRAAAKSLDEKNTRAVAEYVAQMKRVVPKRTIVASTAAGELLYNERCMECHRFNAEGELAFGSAPLVGLQDWYLKSQLIKYKNGTRGVLKEDANGQKMAFAVGFIEDDEALVSVVAYLVTLQEELALAAKKKKGFKDPFEEVPVPAQK